MLSTDEAYLAMILALLVTLGSGLGGLGRYLLGLWIRSISGEGFPYWTLAVNIIGSFLIVFIAGCSADERVRAFALIGLMGGFTTFSSFSMETLKLMQDDHLLQALLNIMLSVIFCVVAAYLGHICSRSFGLQPS